MALLFVRHGSTVLNAGDPADPRDYFRGWTPAPLSDFGHKTMAQTADWFQKNKVQLSSIVSSDMPRSVQSAQHLSQATGVPVQIDQRLRPLNIGHLTEQLITPDNIKLLDQAQKDHTMPLPGGESYSDFLNRYKSILPELLQAGQQGNVAVVTHHRNLLALPNIFFNQPITTKGPPEPGGVMVLTQKGLKPLFTPIQSKEAYNEHAAS